MQVLQSVRTERSVINLAAITPASYKHASNRGDNDTADLFCKTWSSHLVKNLIGNLHHATAISKHCHSMPMPHNCKQRQPIMNASTTYGNAFYGHHQCSLHWHDALVICCFCWCCLLCFTGVWDGGGVGNSSSKQRCVMGVVLYYLYNKYGGNKLLSSLQIVVVPYNGKRTVLHTI